jgi:Trp operon repressor
LVFVPVALTWIAVSKATDAFGEYTAANKGAVVNFLEFWQNGYGVLASEWTIGHVAFLDAAIIGVVIALSLTVSFLEIQHKKILSTFVAKSENERLALGIKIHKYLHTKRVSTPEVVNANVTSSTRNLLATSKELMKVSKELAKDLKKTGR